VEPTAAGRHGVRVRVGVRRGRGGRRRDGVRHEDRDVCAADGEGW